MNVIPIAPIERSPPSEVAAYLRPGTLSLPALPPLSLYVHFPWCVRKCPYCDFNSHEPVGGTDRIPEARYLAALRQDLEAALPLIWGRRFISVFIGGGTPSLLSSEGVDGLLSDLRALLPLEADCEITLEANPGTVEAGRFAAFRAAGVNRLSIGIQSLDDVQLKRLGRIHDGAQAIRAIETARREFDNFNLDLMYGLPEQSLEGAQRDVEAALAAAPPHLSLYQLTSRAEHGVRQASTAATGRGYGRSDAGVDRSPHGPGRLPSLRSLGLRVPRSRVPAQQELLGVR